jgi:hypothetical protein
MVSMLASGAVDHGFIGGVVVSMLASGVVDHGFIGVVMVTMLQKISTRPTGQGWTQYTYFDFEVITPHYDATRVLLVDIHFSMISFYRQI